MIRSMTGFGRYEAEDGVRKICVEIKSVNHRYLDLSIRMPRKFNALESKLRGVVKESVKRGKVDIYITCEQESGEGATIRYNRQAAREYMEYLQQMQEEFGLENDIRLSGLSRYPDVFTIEENYEDDEELWSLLEKAARGALEQFGISREREGEQLCADLLEKLDGMLVNVETIEKRLPEALKDYENRLRAKVAELLEHTEIDETRLLMETTVYADKICVDEEMVRLRSHIAAAQAALNSGGEVGRKLDFLAQEMNREANTTLSKSGDLALSNAAIDLKTDIEKVREQVQNLE